MSFVGTAADIENFKNILKMRIKKNIDVFPLRCCGYKTESKFNWGKIMTTEQKKEQQ